MKSIKKQITISEKTNEIFNKLKEDSYIKWDSQYIEKLILEEYQRKQNK